jgi:hypothetical protein
MAFCGIIFVAAILFCVYKYRNGGGKNRHVDTEFSAMPDRDAGQYDPPRV